MDGIEALKYLDDIAHGREMDLDPHELKEIVSEELEAIRVLKELPIYINYDSSFPSNSNYGSAMIFFHSPFDNKMWCLYETCEKDKIEKLKKLKEILKK